MALGDAPTRSTLVPLMAARRRRHSPPPTAYTPRRRPSLRLRPDMARIAVPRTAAGRDRDELSAFLAEGDGHPRCRVFAPPYRRFRVLSALARGKWPAEPERVRSSDHCKLASALAAWAEEYTATLDRSNPDPHAFPTCRQRRASLRTGAELREQTSPPQSPGVMAPASPIVLMTGNVTRREESNLPLDSLRSCH